MIRSNVQKIGSFISSMIIPNIGAFIAWGFIAAIFSPTGWFPNERISTLIDPLKNYLLPLLVGYTGGKVTGGARGGIVASIATIGVICGANIPMILGAIIIGPVSGYLIKKLDIKLKDKIPYGFEMLVNNFSLAFMGIILAIIGLVIIGPSIIIVDKIMNKGVYFIIRNGLLPLLAIFIEPIKVLFLNNVMNHGIINIIAMDQITEYGKSILYLLEANPGPGLGVILSYYIYSKGVMKQFVPSAAIIQFFGGIHEIYFPYILLNPQLLIAAIIGNTVSIMIFLIFNTGLISLASPGSIFSIMMLSYKGDILKNLLGVFGGAIVSFFIATILLKRKYRKNVDININKKNKNELNFDIKSIKKIVFACDVGMGSSAMGARNFINKIKDFKLDIEVINSSISNIPSDSDIIITHKGLLGGIKKDINKSKIICIENFLEDDTLELLYEKFKKDKYDLVILDVMMPKLNGYSLCKMIKNLNKQVSIIFLTALDDEESEIKGFDLDADDYISKPFSFNILVKRVEAVLKRKNKEEKNEDILEFEGLKLDLEKFKSYVDDEEIELTLKEFNILKLMLASYPKVVSREKLIEKIWGYEYFGDTRVIDAHMKNIRKKIKKDYIKTIKGVGYVLEK